MSRLRRVTVWLFLGVLVLVLATWGAALSTLPKTSGVLVVAGPSAPVEIARDAHGIPTITADNRRDAAFGLGFVHGQDRLFQMDLLRRVAAGRLAEVLGHRAVRTDVFMRTLGLMRAADSSLAVLQPETVDRLDAYADGVNAAISEQTLLPPEFLLLGYEPEPWTALDTLAFGRLMALRLSGNWREEALRAAFLDRLPAEAVDELWAEGPVDAPPAMGRLAPALAHAFLEIIPPQVEPLLASNAWIVGSGRTASGGALLANDPHLELQAPIQWYLARLRSPEGRVTGGTMPGMPFVLVGHTDRLAWGLTTTHSDTADLFVEELTGDGSYATPDGPRPLEQRRETIVVAGGDPVLLDVQESRHGPLVGALIDRAQADGTALALQSMALAPDDRTADALRALETAETVPEAIEALRRWDSPQQNLFLADHDNGIAFIAPGRVPIRASGMGLVPQSGADGAHDWIGTVPFEDLPRVVNPEAGFLVNANNRPVSEGAGPFLGAHWPPAYRAMRLTHRLEDTEAATLDSQRQIQLDVRSLAAQALTPRLVALARPGEASAEALAVMAGWDFEMRADAAAPMLYAVWVEHLSRRLFADDLGDVYRRWGPADPRVLLAVLDGDTERDWCDDITTEAVENCITQAAATLTEAVASLSARHGPMRRWRWGDAHRASLEHPLFRFIPVLDRLTAIRPGTAGGDHTVNRGSWISDGDGAFPHVHGPGLRAVIDVAAPQDSGFVIATGQSGNPLSPHWSDLTEAWMNGRLIRLTAPPEAVLRLNPASL